MTGLATRRQLLVTGLGQQRQPRRLHQRDDRWTGVPFDQKPLRPNGLHPYPDVRCQRGDERPRNTPIRSGAHVDVAAVPAGPAPSVAIAARFSSGIDHRQGHSTPMILTDRESGQPTQLPDRRGLADRRQRASRMPVVLGSPQRVIAALGDDGTLSANALLLVFAPTKARAGVVVGEEHLERVPQATTPELPVPRVLGGRRQAQAMRPPDRRHRNGVEERANRCCEER